LSENDDENCSESVVENMDRIKSARTIVAHILVFLQMFFFCLLELRLSLLPDLMYTNEYALYPILMQNIFVP
jgi:hypothetical protein